MLILKVDPSGFWTSFTYKAKLIMEKIISTIDNVLVRRAS